MLAYHLELVDSSRTINVTSYEQRLLVLLGLEHIGKLTTKCGLTRTLQTAHKYDSGTTCQVQFGCFATHKFSKLVVHNLHHKLAWLNGSKHVHTHSLLLHRVGKCLCYLVVNVGIKQCASYVFKCFCNVDLGDFSLTFKYLKTAFQSVA